MQQVGWRPPDWNLWPSCYDGIKGGFIPGWLRHRCNMLLKTLHVVFALLVALFSVGAAILAWNDLPMAPAIVAACLTSFFWFTTWRNLTDLHKDDLLDEVDCIEEDDEDAWEGAVDPHGAGIDAAQPTDQIQAGLPKQRAENPSSDIRRM